MRPTNAPGVRHRLASLDGVRGLAVILVIGSHAHIPVLGPGGASGVTTFFVLSGFLITGILLTELERTGRIDVRAFLLRRALRLAPALWVVVGVVVVASLFLTTAGALGVTRWALPALFYYSNFALLHEQLGPLSHTWSLAVEEQFYLVWPLLLLLVCLPLRGTRWRRSVLFALLLAMTAFSVWLRYRVGAGPGGADAAARRPDTTAFALTAGAALAVVHRGGWRPGRLARPLALGAAAVLLLAPHALALVGQNDWVTVPVVAGLAALVLVAACSGEAHTVFASPVLRHVGTISYGLYLWHFPVIWAIDTGTLATDRPGLAVAAAVLGSFVAAELSWRFVEQPVLRYKKRLERAHLDTEVTRERAPHRRTGQARHASRPSELDLRGDAQVPAQVRERDTVGAP